MLPLALLLLFFFLLLLKLDLYPLLRLFELLFYFLILLDCKMYFWTGYYYSEDSSFDIMNFFDFLAFCFIFSDFLCGFIDTFSDDFCFKDALFFETTNPVWFFYFCCASIFANFVFDFSLFSFLEFLCWTITKFEELIECFLEWFLTDFFGGTLTFLKSFSSFKSRNYLEYYRLWLSLFSLSSMN